MTMLSILRTHDDREIPVGRRVHRSTRRIPRSSSSAATS